MTRLTLVLLSLLVLPLSGCGIKGSLKTPPLIWGSKADPETQEDTQQDTQAETREDTSVGYGIEATQPDT